MLALALAAGSARAQPGNDSAQRVVIAVLPYGTSVEDLAAVPGISPGVMSAGLGDVPVAQTYLDISQGNRINKRLYGPDLPRLYVRGGRVPAERWRRTVERADDAPANVVPGLLGSTLAEVGIPVSVESDSGLATLIAVDRDGVASVRPARRCARGCGPGLSVVRARLPQLFDLAAELGPDDLLIAIASGIRSDQQLLTAGIAGEGFDGNLTSSSTRTDGVFLSTDVAPTVLERFGVEIPDEVNGSAIEVEGEPDPEEVADLQARLADRPSRDLVVLLPLAVWTLAAALAALAFGARGGRRSFSLLGLACAWAPLLLLLAAATDADEPVSALIVGVGSPALATATRALIPGYRGLALACAASVGAHALDVVAGSPYTALSVLGPNPGGGVRFFGIGNELEAVLTTQTVVGTGAWLASRRDLSTRDAAAWFLGLAALAAAAFAPGRFGADVGAAIVLAVGGATAAALALGFGVRRTVLSVLAAGALGLAALVAVDLALGGAHLSRSVLGAGEAGDVLDVLDRRVTLMANTFIHPVYPELLVASAVALVLGFARRRTILAWFGGRWAARAGYLGAVTGVLVGTVANDSGSVLLVIGTIYLAAFAGFFWGEAPRSHALGDNRTPRL